MSLTLNEAHATEAVDLLPSVFDEQPNIVAMVTAVANQIQDLEGAIYQLYLGRRLDDAVGVQLDQIGVIVGQERNGMVDGDYLPMLRARIVANRSSGTASDILAVARLVLGYSFVGATYELSHQYPAASCLRVLDVEIPSATAEILSRRFLRHAKAAGTYLVLETTSVDTVDLFVFGTSQFDGADHFADARV